VGFLGREVAGRPGICPPAGGKGTRREAGANTALTALRKTRCHCRKLNPASK
jgi:hypothetical protein